MNNLPTLDSEADTISSVSLASSTANIAAVPAATDTTIAYHLDELSHLSDPYDVKNDYPVIDDKHNVILDVGCGIGQAYVGNNFSSKSGKTLYGIDIDFTPLQFGKKYYPGIHFINGSAESIPLQSNHVDFLISRVSLPYTNVPGSMAEIYRVLKPGGEIWITLHPFSFFSDLIKDCWHNFTIKKLLDRVYILGNGMIFHVTGKLIRRPVIGGMESLQSEKAMARLMRNLGFENVEMTTTRSHFLITANKPKRKIKKN